GPGNPVQLTKDSSDDIGPRWSPDGKWIAFLRPRSSRTGDVYLIPALGGLERKLADSALLWCLSCWPDGRWLVIARRTSPEQPIGWALLSADTGETRALPLAVTPPEVANTFSASFAPDGHAMALPVAGGGIMIQPLSDFLQPKGSPTWI